MKNSKVRHKFFEIFSLVIIAVFVFASVSFAKSEKVCYFDCNNINGNKIIDNIYAMEGVTNNVTPSEGGKIFFDNSQNSYVTFEKKISEAIYNCEGFTFSADINAVRTDNFKRYRIFGTYIDNKMIGTEIYILPDNRLVVGMRSSAGDKWQSKSYRFDEFGKTINLTLSISYKEKQVSLFYDGIKQTPQKGGDNVDFLSPVYKNNNGTKKDYIGGDGIFGNSFNGYMDNIRIYRGNLPVDFIKKLSGTLQYDVYSDIKNESHLIMKKDSVELSGVYGRKYIGNYDSAPFLFDEKLYLPAKESLFNLGFSYREQNGTVTASDNNNTLVLVAGENKVRINNQNYAIDEYIRIHNQKIFLPLSVFLKMGYNISDDRYLIIHKAKQNFSYDEKEYINYMLDQEFKTSNYKEPTKNHRLTEKTVAKSGGGRQYIGSPSLLKLSDGDLIASHDIFGGDVTDYLQRVYISHDKGDTWEFLSEVKNQYWSSLFEDNGNIYLIGVSGPGGDIVIRKSSDRGKTWSVARDEKTGIIARGNNPYDGWYHAGSTEVLKANGRIYRCLEDGSTPETNYRHKKALVVSAPEGCDLLDAENWTMSNKILFDKAWQPHDWYTKDTIWIEGNPIKGKDGKLYNLMRLETFPTYSKAALLTFSPDGKNLEFDTQNGFVDFFGGSSLSNTKYDENTDCYISLVNNITDPVNPYHRNVLSLSYSYDLRNWNIAETILCDNYSDYSWQDSVRKKGYQYTDWVIDGDDILILVRESKNTGNYHNADYLTFYKIKDYKKYILPYTQAALYNDYKEITKSEKGNIVAEIEFDNTKNDSDIYLCRYNGGKLTEVKAQKAYKNGERTKYYIKTKADENDEIRLFVWEKGMRPVLKKVLE